MPTCPECSTEYAQAALSCPSCHRLVHGERLRALSTQAEAHTAAARYEEAMNAWGEALELLPEGSRQAEQVRARNAQVARLADGPAQPDEKKAAGAGRFAALGAVGLLLWKLKPVVLLVVTKGKTLLLGLTKLKTFASMALAMGVYWTVWGWKFALGFVLSIYVHEMGHVMALRKLGIPASAPMFIPGVGAFVRLKTNPTSARDDAHVGLAGPLWGLYAALFCYAVFLATGWPFWGAIASTGAWVNLFNLLPIWQLDGGRAFRALTRTQRWWAAAAILLAWLYTGDGLLVLLVLAAGYRAIIGEQASEPHRGTLFLYVTLIAALSLLSAIDIPLPAGS
jgi:Zn-dependent protease